MPADDITDPAPATTFSHLDATTVLSRSVAEAGLCPPPRPPRGWLWPWDSFRANFFYHFGLQREWVGIVFVGGGRVWCSFPRKYAQMYGMDEAGTAHPLLPPKGGSDALSRKTFCSKKGVAEAASGDLLYLAPANNLPRPKLEAQWPPWSFFLGPSKCPSPQFVQQAPFSGPWSQFSFRKTLGMYLRPLPPPLASGAFLLRHLPRRGAPGVRLPDHGPCPAGLRPHLVIWWV